jgi:hypothetical protein
MIDKDLHFQEGLEEFEGSFEWDELCEHIKYWKNHLYIFIIF